MPRLYHDRPWQACLQSENPEGDTDCAPPHPNQTNSSTTACVQLLVHPLVLSVVQPSAACQQFSSVFFLALVRCNHPHPLRIHQISRRPSPGSFGISPRHLTSFFFLDSLAQSIQSPLPPPLRSHRVNRSSKGHLALQESKYNLWITCCQSLNTTS